MEYFNINDIIEITNYGGLYLSYEEMADFLELKNWKKGYNPKTKQKGRIISKKYSEECCRVLYGIRLINNYDIILAADYFDGRYKIIEKNVSLPDELFQI